MSSGYTPTFGDWTAVAQTYGSDIANLLQQNNIPLSQVAQTVAKAYPNYSYGAGGTYSGGQSGIVQSGGQGTTSSPSFTVQQNPATQAVQQFFSGGSGGGGTTNMSGANNPNFQTSLLGAQALEAVGLNPTKTATINPSPADTPTSSQFAQSGVSAVSGPSQVDISGYKMPTPGANMPAGTGTVFNAAAQNAPTVKGAMPVLGGMPGVAPAPQYTQPTRPELRHGMTPQPISPYITPTQQATGAQPTQATPFATPPQSPQVQIPQSPQVQIPQVPQIQVPPAAPPPSTWDQGHITDHPFVSRGMGSITSPPLQAPASSTPVAIPRFQGGGLVTDPTVGLIGEAGPEAVIPVTDQNWPAISGMLPTQYSNAVQRGPYAQISGYGPGYPPPRQQAPPQPQVPPRQTFQLPREFPRQAPPAAPGPPQVGPPAPGTQSYALNTGTQIGPPNPSAQQQAQANALAQVGPPNPTSISSTAQAAADSAINNVMTKNQGLTGNQAAGLIGMASHVGDSLLRYAQSGNSIPIRNAIPSPDDFKRQQNNQIVLGGASQGFA